MEILAEAKKLFAREKPTHFVDFNHCEECSEHDATLLKHDVDTISLEELGNPGWDPICFVDVNGFKYYFPALIRLCLESGNANGSYYIDQFLFHISYGATEKEFLLEFSDCEKGFVSNFLNYLLDEKTQLIEENLDTDDLLSAIETWQNG